MRTVCWPTRGSARTLAEAAREYRERITLVPADQWRTENLGIALRRQNLDARPSLNSRAPSRSRPTIRGPRHSTRQLAGGGGTAGQAVRSTGTRSRWLPESVAVHNALAAVLAAQANSEAAVNQFSAIARARPEQSENAAGLRGAAVSPRSVTEASRVAMDRRE